MTKGRAGALAPVQKPGADAPRLAIGFTLSVAGKSMEAPHIIDHPVLGRLRWEAPDQWYGQITLPSGKSMDVIIYTGDADRMVFLEEAAQLSRRVMADERRILLDAVRKELLNLASEWRQEDEPEWTEYDLMRLLQLEMVEITEGSIVPVELSYSEPEDRFGGHIVAVQLNHDLGFRGIDLRG